MLIAVLVAGAFWLVASAFPSERDRAGNAALNYANTHTLWIAGPHVQSVQVVPLSGLDAAMRRSVSPGVRADVNVPDLRHRYGATHRVALVVLYGEYNTLPPGEGVNVHGDMVCIVDAHTNQVLLLTD